MKQKFLGAGPVTALITVLALTACAPLNKDQCRTANWQQLGYQSGLKGREAARFEEERKACADHKIDADATGWKIGYAQGLGMYCTAAHGYEVGRRGESYGDVCPPESDALFRPAFQDGHLVSKLVATLKDRRARFDEISRALADDDRRARDYVNQARDGSKPPPVPPTLMDKYQRRDLEGQYNQLRREIDDLRQEFESRDGDLSARYQLPVMGYDE